LEANLRTFAITPIRRGRFRLLEKNKIAGDKQEDGEDYDGYFFNPLAP